MRLPSRTEGDAEQKDAEKKTRGRDTSSEYDDASNASRACRPGQRSSRPSMAVPTFHPSSTTIYLPPFFLHTIQSVKCLLFSRDHEQQQLLQSRPVAGNQSMEARVEQCLEGTGRLLRDSVTRAESRVGLRWARHECPAHDAGPLAANHSHLPKGAQRKPFLSKPQQRPWRPLLNHVNGKKRRGASASKNARRPQKSGRFTAAPSRTPLKKRSCGETRQDRDHEGGILGDHGDTSSEHSSTVKNKRRSP